MSQIGTALVTADDPAINNVGGMTLSAYSLRFPVEKSIAHYFLFCVVQRFIYRQLLGARCYGLSLS